MALVGQSQAQVANSYNAKMVYFLGDLGPTFPCHPLYDRTYTWISSDNDQSVEAILNGLVNAGFNGVRLPMWPESDRVTGPNPYRVEQDIDVEYCDFLVKNIVKVIKDAPTSSSYYGMYIYFSPAFDSRLYQEDMTTQEYADWVSKFYSDDYQPDFLSPFSANQSFLKYETIPSDSVMGDP